MHYSKVVFTLLLGISLALVAAPAVHAAGDGGCTSPDQCAIYGAGYTCDLTIDTCVYGTGSAQSDGSCAGPADHSCGSGKVCQQGSNGFYQCFTATTPTGSCTGPSDTSCGEGNSCQQDANGFYGCFPNANGSSGLNGTTGAGGINGSGGSTGTTGSGAGSINTAYIQGYETSIVGVINNILVPLLIAVAFLLFIWGAFKYFIWGGADPTSRSEGAQYILWAVVGFAVIFSVWGLVNLLIGTLGVSTGGTHPTPPTL